MAWGRDKGIYFEKVHFENSEKKNRGHITVKSDFKKMCHLKFCNVSRSLQVRKGTGSISVFLILFRKSAISFLYKIHRNKLS